ncbi:MAG TPA: adenosylcobinamide-GDP ribazoletransferase [Candidatus Binatia bacterium]|nr:adenosylcobinamide-GDP ribazoletransferase [Candidatus Binatia bacterium]
MIGSGAVYFPLIGLLLGLLLALLNYGLGLYLDAEILTIFLVAVLLAASGGAHLDGVKKTFAGFAPDPGRTIHSNDQFFGYIAVLFVILFKISSVNVLGEKIALSLLLTPVFARWALVLCIYGYHDRCEETARRIAENVRFWHVLLTTVATLGVAVYLLGRKGLWIGLSVSVLALFARSLLHRRHAALTQDNFGAVIELGETLSLLLLASL